MDHALFIDARIPEKDDTATFLKSLVFGFVKLGKITEDNKESALTSIVNLCELRSKYLKAYGDIDTARAYDCALTMLISHLSDDEMSSIIYRSCYKDTSSGVVHDVTDVRYELASCIYNHVAACVNTFLRELYSSMAGDIYALSTEAMECAREAIVCADRLKSLMEEIKHVAPFACCFEEASGNLKDLCEENVDRIHYIACVLPHLVVISRIACSEEDEFDVDIDIGRLFSAILVYISHIPMRDGKHVKDAIQMLSLIFSARCAFLDNPTGMEKWKRISACAMAASTGEIGLSYLPKWLVEKTCIKRAVDWTREKGKGYGVAITPKMVHEALATSVIEPDYVINLDTFKEALVKTRDRLNQIDGYVDIGWLKK